MTADAPHASPAPSPGARPCNLLSVLWMQASALFARLSRIPRDFARLIPSLEALLRAYVCGAANDRLVADSDLRLRLTQEAERREQARAASQFRDEPPPAPSEAPAPGPPRGRAPQFDPFPPPQALIPFVAGDIHKTRPLPPRPSWEDPRFRRGRDAGGRTARKKLRPESPFPGHRPFTPFVVVDPEKRLAAIARVIADPEPAIWRAMRIIAARWEDHTLRFPTPERDPVPGMPGEQAHIAHPRPELAAAIDRSAFEVLEEFWIGPPPPQAELADSS